MAGREARAKRATTAFTRRESSECTFFSRKLFFFDHHAIQGENPKVSKRPAGQGFRQHLGFQDLGGSIKKTPQKFFFLPARAVVARFARASLAATGGEAKGPAGGGPQKKFREGLKGRGSSLPIEVSLPLGCRKAVFAFLLCRQSPASAGSGRGWKLNKVRVL